MSPILILSRDFYSFFSFHLFLLLYFHTLYFLLYLQLQAVFYVELLKSLILEGQPRQAKTLLELRELGRVSAVDLSFVSSLALTYSFSSFSFSF